MLTATAAALMLISAPAYVSTTTYPNHVTQTMGAITVSIKFSTAKEAARDTISNHPKAEKRRIKKDWIKIQNKITEAIQNGDCSIDLETVYTDNLKKLEKLDYKIYDVPYRIIIKWCE